MITLARIAKRIEAASRLFQSTRSLQEEDHQIITDEATNTLNCIVEAVVFADHIRDGVRVPMSEDLASQLAIRLPYENIEALTAEQILDEFVSTHLSSLASALRVIETVYLEDDGNQQNQNLGNAMFECLHWLEVARHDLGGLIMDTPTLRVAA